MDENTVAYKLGSIESKLDAFIDRQDKSEKVDEDHEKRIKSLETSRAKLWGISVVLIFIIEYFKTQFGKFL